MKDLQLSSVLFVQIGVFTWYFPLHTAHFVHFPFTSNVGEVEVAWLLVRIKDEDSSTFRVDVHCAVTNFVVVVETEFNVCIVTNAIIFYEINIYWTLEETTLAKTVVPVFAMLRVVSCHYKYVQENW